MVTSKLALLLVTARWGMVMSKELGVGDLFGQIVLKEAAGVDRVGESGFEKFVVWMMDGFLRHGLFKRVADGRGGCRQELTDEGRVGD